MKKKAEILYVSIYEAKPNKTFKEEQRQAIRFLIYNKPLPCAECGREKKKMWTMLCQFKAPSMGMITVKESGKSHLPLTPVCDEHLLAPDFPIESGKTL
jgi:hypothetical protein